MIMLSKLTWIIRLLGETIPWIKFFRHTKLENLQNIINFGPYYGYMLKEKCYSFFHQTPLLPG